MKVRKATNAEIAKNAMEAKIENNSKNAMNAQN